MKDDVTMPVHPSGTLPDAKKQTERGVAYALLIVALWISTLIVSLVPEYLLSAWSIAALLGIMAVRTFLSTGLFIVAHDAIHGTVAPRLPRLNDAIGRLAAFIYAFFPFRKLASHHWAHHARPGTEHDPDFHRSGCPQFFKWYTSFIFTYADWRQLLGFALVYNLLAHVGGVAQYKLWLVWIAPAMLSTVQLFYFGTYLPHRLGSAEFRDRHRARSSAYPTWLSLVTCYHFGLHLEHHRRPEVPWWLLPSVRMDHGTREPIETESR